MTVFKNCTKIKKKSLTKININREPYLIIHTSIFNSKLSNGSRDLERKIVNLKNNTLYNLEKQISCFMRVEQIKRSCFLINRTCYTSLRNYLFFKSVLNLREKKVMQIKSTRNLMYKEI